MKLKLLLVGGLALWNTSLHGEPLISKDTDPRLIDATGGSTYEKQVAEARRLAEQARSFVPVYDVPWTKLKGVSVLLKENGKGQIVLLLKAKPCAEARAFIQNYANESVRVGLGDYRLPVDVPATLKAAEDVYLKEQTRSKVAAILDSLLKEQK